MTRINREMNKLCKSSIEMYKGGVGLGGGGSGGGGGPTAAETEKPCANIGILVDNFGFVVIVARVNDQPLQNSQESLMMEMRSAMMQKKYQVQASESLLKLVSELKQTSIFSGFASLSDHIDQRIDEFNKLVENMNNVFARIGERMAVSLKGLESRYYSSTLRTRSSHES